MGSVYIIDSLIFDSGSSELPTEGYGKMMLDTLVSYVKKKKGMAVNVMGYTDASGIEDKNILISRERAKAVKDYLIANGLSEESVNHYGYGSKNPIAPNRYKWGRDLNRRIEIEFVAR